MDVVIKFLLCYAWLLCVVALMSEAIAPGWLDSFINSHPIFK